MAAFSIRTGRFARLIAVPAMLGVCALAALVGGLLVWAGQEADEVAVDRQVALATLVVSNLRETIAHNQESVTVWDDAVTAVGEPSSAEWIDYNLGSWMHTYFGHDGAYVLDPANTPIYQFSTHSDDRPYRDVEEVAKPLVDALRQRSASGDESGISDRILSLGEADIGIVAGRPTLVSVKPVVSDTGDIEQTPGTEYLHVAVRFLDSDFVAALSRDYQFDDLRFSWTPALESGQANLPLTTASGATVGYFAWQPYRPGAAVVSRIAPVAAAALAMMLGLVGGLLFLLDRRSHRLAERDAKMKHLALHDPLTELPNRALFHDRLDAALRGQSDSELVAVLYLDLDHFKQVNDTLGHPAGDAVIIEFGKRLSGLIRSTDTLSRLGGDEFTVVIPALRSVEDVELLSDRIIDTIRQPFDIDGHQVFIGVTIGIAIAPRDGDTRTELCRKADIALYHAKSSGRSRYAMFGAEMGAILQARRDIERDLRAALAGKDQLEVHYQPLFNAATQKIIGVEALLRWRHPYDGWISPDVFIPIAEETGQIEAVGDFVLREACNAAKLWPSLAIAVNVSAIELRNPAFATKVAALLLETEIDPRRIELELTESALTDPNGVGDQNVKALRALGVRIALDDFGTGFSSLGRLQQLEVDRIKIDRSFVSGFGRLNGDEAIVQAIVELAKARGLKTTAEGVETVEQGTHLQSIGCDDLQGFLYSRPVPPIEVTALLARGSFIAKQA
ncbi:EAL domain-containing protein [Mesorhizobium sp. YIM 152430]|uniref:putative bifunctional diguanylate cyclase/phosphodiesterase n=1 Tax=Mesorhizobium sp. YIM 152430 TaxID=3031761 RepID=UPI0023D9B4FD|nr:EAL domain-containing protein [Mesorhizobium sp. YIM 152430]MDF1600889.1 EAL domain-containing protein [Mesorhizobium sp. YIM 152430]